MKIYPITTTVNRQPSILNIQCLTFFIFHFSFFILPLFAQNTPSSAQPDRPESHISHLKKVLPGLLKGIAAADYQKIGINEYFPLTALALPQEYLPSTTHHPRLITPMQIHHARRAIHQMPQQEWYRRIKSDADKSLAGPPTFDSSPLSNRSESFKNLAFVFLIEEDRRYLTALSEWFRQLPDLPQILNLEGGPFGRGWGDYLESAEALPALCVALDLVYHEIDPLLRRNILRKLRGVALQLSDAMIYNPANNHVTLFAIALMTYALLEDPLPPGNFRDRQALWQRGSEYLSRALGLVSPDGGYAEGVYYANFISHYLAPLSIYWRNSTGYRLFGHPYLSRMVDWMLANEKGSGSFSGFDDAFQNDFFYLPLVIDQIEYSSNAAAYLPGEPMPWGPFENLVEAICIFQNRPASQINVNRPVRFFAESGQAIFRDRAPRPQIFATFLAEREARFADRHEHIEPLSFELSAFGEDLIVDGGYGRGTPDVNRGYYVSAQAANGILVDGMGTWRNPIWGDSVGSHLQHSFAARHLAGTLMAHSIDDVELQRRAFFLDNRLLLMIDHFSNAAGKAVAINFNYQGHLRQIDERQYRIRQGQANLDMLVLSGDTRPARVSSNFALFTPSGGPQEIRSLQVEHPPGPSGYFLTMLLPEIAGNGRPMVMPLGISGQGQAMRIKPLENGAQVSVSEIDLAVNGGGDIGTARWSSDARVIWVNYNDLGEIRGLGLTEFSYFRSDKLAIESRQPLNLFVEFDDAALQGYLEGPPGNYSLSIVGTALQNWRFNRKSLQPRKNDAGHLTLELRGAGILEAGTRLEAVYRPYQFHRYGYQNAHIARQPSGRPEYYQQDLFREAQQQQATAFMVEGFSTALSHWGDKYFGDENLPINAVHLAAGIGSSSYDRTSGTTYSISLPHRYRLRGRNGQTRWSLFEEGVFSPDNLRIRNLGFSAEQEDFGQIDYRYGRWFEGHRSHQLRLQGAAGLGLFYHDAAAGEARTRRAELNWSGNQGVLRPGVIWQSGSLAGGSLDWRWRRYGGRFDVDRSQAGNPESFRQNFYGGGERWALAFRGEQPGGRGQHFEAEGFWQFRQQLTVSPRLLIQQEQAADRWRLPLAALSVIWRRPDFSLHGAIDRYPHRNSEYLSGFWRVGRQRWQTALRLNNFEFDRESRVSLLWQNSGRAAMTHRVSYGYDAGFGDYAATVNHQFSLPLGRRAILMPTLSENLLAGQFLQGLGSGFSWWGRRQLTLLGLMRRFGEAYQFNYQAALAGDLPGILGAMEIWLDVFQQEDLLLSWEMRIMQHSAAGRSPGIYYRYRREEGIRLEGAMEWRF